MSNDENNVIFGLEEDGLEPDKMLYEADVNHNSREVIEYSASLGKRASAADHAFAAAEHRAAALLQEKIGATGVAEEHRAQAVHHDQMAAQRVAKRKPPV